MKNKHPNFHLYRWLLTCLVLVITFVMALTSKVTAIGAANTPIVTSTPVPTETQMPVPSLTPSPTTPPTPTLSVDQRLERLEEKTAYPTKDFWDILNALSSLITGGIVVVLLAYINYRYTQEQHRKENELKVQEIGEAKIQSVKSLMPHLANPNETELLILALAVKGELELAISMATTFPQGGNRALVHLAKNNDRQIATEASQALAKGFHYASIVRILLDKGDWLLGFCVHENLIATIAEPFNKEKTPVIEIYLNEQVVAASIFYRNDDYNLILLMVDSLKLPSLPPIRGNVNLRQQEVYQLYLQTEESINMMICSSANERKFHPYPVQLTDVKPRENIAGSRAGIFNGAPTFSGEGQVIGMVVEIIIDRDQNVVDHIYLLPSKTLYHLVQIALTTPT